MATIRKQFPTLKKAESYQNKLYGKYDRVELVSAPRFSENGSYSWRVG